MKIFSIIILLLLSGCSARGSYDSFGIKQKNDCYKIGGTPQECESRESYDSYKQKLDNSQIVK